MHAQGSLPGHARRWEGAFVAKVGRDRDGGLGRDRTALLQVRPLGSGQVWRAVGCKCCVGQDAGTVEPVVSRVPHSPNHTTGTGREDVDGTYRYMCSGCGAGMGYIKSLTRIDTGKCHSLPPPGRRRLAEAMRLRRRLKAPPGCSCPPARARPDQCMHTRVGCDTDTCVLPWADDIRDKVSSPSSLLPVPHLAPVGVLVHWVPDRQDVWWC